ncbi:MAG: DUF3726 domain-containing protein [Pseudomonadota bacterium]
MPSLTRTLSEIQATCTKAARGAGCPWGLAEEAGLAARVLEAHGLPGISTVADLFKTPRSCACDGKAPGRSCGLAKMAAVSDAPPQDVTVLGPVAGPLLLIAPGLMDDTHVWHVDWLSGSVQTTTDGVAIKGAPPPTVAERLTIARTGLTRTAKPVWQSRNVDAIAWTKLEALAARTYVPDTDASRLSGAGPADTDKD